MSEPIGRGWYPIAVFIASPGDGQRERQIAREVGERLGKFLGFALDPVGWERDAALDAGRPQGG